MDNAVALVQAYLRLNGYFTVSEYPVIASGRDGQYRTATDLDILAVRFPNAGRLVPAVGGRTAADEDHLAPDCALAIPVGQADMLVGEVKEGQAVLNAAATNPDVLRAVIVSFGCCSREEAPQIVQALIRNGHAKLPIGHQIRLVAFGALVDSHADTHANAHHLSIGLRHIVEYLQQYLRAHWDVLRHIDSKDPAFGFLITLKKALGGKF